MYKWPSRPALFVHRTTAFDIPINTHHNGSAISFRYLLKANRSSVNEIKVSELSVTAHAGGVFGFANGISVVFQKDGNFVAYKPGGAAVAATASNSSGDELLLRFQTDGNLVVYNKGTALWASQTGGVAKGAELVIRDETPYIRIVGKDGKVFYTANHE